jgi:hypothetical protein
MTTSSPWSTIAQLYSLLDQLSRSFEGNQSFGLDVISMKYRTHLGLLDILVACHVLS